MALPTSTIVMAVLTCVPFGLAIRDTVSGKALVIRSDDNDYGASDDDVDYAAENARREAEEAAVRAAERVEEANKEQLRAARRSLFGAEVATLGSGFSGITLGMNEGDIRSETVTALETATRVDVELVSNGTLDMILIKSDIRASEDDDAELCSQLGSDLQDAWGRGQTEDYEGRYWMNPITRTRASLSAPDGCRFRLEKYVEPKEWVTKARTSSVPTWLVGQSIAKLREHLGTRSQFEDTDREVTWVGVGVGVGSGETRFQAHFVKGKVVALTATTDTFDVTRDAVIAQLTALYGPAIEDDEGVHWKRPALSVDDYDGAGIRVTAGTVPGYE